MRPREKAGARHVWPPRERDRSPAGQALAVDFAESLMADEGRFYLECDPDYLEQMTTRPELYETDAVRDRLTDCFARMPMDFFDIFRSRRRKLCLYVMPGEPLVGFGMETLSVGEAGDRDYVVYLRGEAVEEEREGLFAGVLVHGLCHVVYDHPPSHGWTPPPDQDRIFIERRENQAIRLACEIGFARETAAYSAQYEKWWALDGWSRSQIDRVHSRIDKYLRDEARASASRARRPRQGSRDL